MTEKELNDLTAKIVARMAHVMKMEEWFAHVRKRNLPENTTIDDLEINAEYQAYGELARCLTLMNLLQEDEEYEMCAVIKDRVDELDEIIRKYEIERERQQPLDGFE